jgi:hypothetical protein
MMGLDRLYADLATAMAAILDDPNTPISVRDAINQFICDLQGSLSTAQARELDTKLAPHTILLCLEIITRDKPNERFQARPVRSYHSA